MRSLRNRLMLPALLFTALISSAQQKSNVNAPKLSTTTPQSVEGGMWRTDAAFDSILHLKNVLLNQSLQITPSLIMADGTTVKLAPMTLDPAGIALLNITDAIKHLPTASALHRSEYGMARVEYSWAWPGAVVATIQNVDETAMLSLHSALQSDQADLNAATQKTKQQSVEGAWWRPFASTEMFLFLGNSSEMTKQVYVELRSETGKTAARTELSVGAHASVKIKPLDLLPTPPSVGATGSIRIKAAGADRSLVAIGGLEDLTNGFSQTLHISEAHPEGIRNSNPHPLTLASPGVLFGVPQTEMQFPAATSFSPYLIVHNAARTPRVISVNATYTQAAHITTKALGMLALAAGETRNFDFRDLSEKQSVKPDKGSIQLTENFLGSEEDLQVETGSMDQTGNYVFEAESHYEEATISRTICYWSTLLDTNTMVSLWNYKPNAQNLILTLFYRGGKYELPIRLEAGADLDLDLASLIRKQIPDKRGRTIPSNISEGSAILASADGMQASLEIASSTSTFNVRNGTCTNQCGTCNGVTGASLSPSRANVNVGQTTQFTPYFTYNTGQTSIASGGTWSTSSSTASVNASGAVTGQSVGSTSVTYSANNEPYGAGYICTGNSFFCPPAQTQSASAPINVGGPAELFVQQDVQQSVSCPRPPATARTITYQIDTSSGSAILSPIRILENVPSNTVSSCNNTIVHTGNSCQLNSTYQPGGNSLFNDYLFAGCPGATTSLPCGFSFPNQQWQWCPDQGPTQTIGTIGADSIRNDVIYIDGNTLGLTGQFFRP